MCVIFHPDKVFSCIQGLFSMAPPYNKPRFFFPEMGGFRRRISPYPNFYPKGRDHAEYILGISILFPFPPPSVIVSLPSSISDCTC